MKDLFDFRLEILKQEIDNLQASIRNYNNILYLVKGWSITIFSSLVALAIQQGNEKIILVSVPTALMFWLIETLARMVQRRFIARYHKIEWFLRSKSKLEDAWQKMAFRHLNFPDMIARYSVKDIGIKASFWYSAKTLQTSALYILQIVIAIILFLGNKLSVAAK